jgi:selenocysteine lyase/cysteine desulfurase
LCDTVHSERIGFVLLRGAAWSFSMVHVQNVPNAIAEIREREFSAAAHMAYFDHASDSPLPARSAAAMVDRIALLQNPLAPVSPREDCLARAHHHIGRLISGDPAHIAFLTNAADATATIANGIDWRPGDEVLVVAGEFASFVYPWKSLERRGVHVTVVAKDGVATLFDDVAAAVTTRTRVLAISHVEYLSGFRNDLAALGALCRGHGMFFVVDASQSLGVLPVEVEQFGIDALIAVGYKWLMAPHGIAVLYISPAAMDKIRPSAPGRYSVKSGWQTGDYALDWYPDARRYHGGALNWIGVCALAESTALLDEIGLPAVTEASRTVLDAIVSRLDGLPVRITSDLRDSHRSSILTFSFGLAELDAALVPHARERGVILGHRALGVRIGAHFWNDATDVDRLIAAIQTFAEANLIVESKWPPVASNR